VVFAMKRTLTDAFIRTLRAPTDGRLEVNDAACRGLALRITPNDVRSWSYRFTNAAGAVQRMSLGGYPTIGLADARLRADALRRELANGVDPVIAQRNRKAEARSKSKTFGHLCERYVIEHARRHCRPRTAEEYERNIKKHLAPHWADRNYDSLMRAEVVERIERIARTHPVAANRVCALVGQIFNFAIAVGLMSATPAVRLRRPGKEKPKTRVLSDDEIKMFWPAIIESPCSRPVGLALRAALLLGLRAGEIAGLRQDELRDFADPKRTALELAGKRTKNARDLWLPLSPLAQATIAEALELSTDDSFVFPGIEGAPIEAHALAKAMYRFGEQAALKTWRDHPPTPHDLRRTLRTRLSAQGTPTEVCDAIMNHAAQDIGRRHYDWHSYEAEKRLALDAWSRTLQAIVDGKSANVVPLYVLRKVTNGKASNDGKTKKAKTRV
jgi:integrase